MCSTLEMTKCTSHVSTGNMFVNMCLLIICFRELQGILACCNPVPPLVRQSLNDIHRIIKAAMEIPLVKVICFMFN